MNILIRNYEYCKCEGNLFGLISAFTTPKLYEEMPIDAELVVTKKDFPILSQTIYVTKQGNGNLCFQFKEE